MIFKKTHTKNSNLKSSVGNANVGQSAGIDSKKTFFIENIARFCDKCGLPYNVNDIQIIQENGLSSIIHFSCSNCKSTHIATFIRPIGVSSRMPINTDLGVSEISRFSKKENISADDVLDIYSQLEQDQSIQI